MSRLKISPSSHTLEGVRHVRSPNADFRPLGFRPELIVIHGISLPPGEFGGSGVEQLFTNNLPADKHPYFRQIQHLKVSAHAFIRRTGELIQFVPFNRRAWHAGESSFEGRPRCNDFSIGIELEGCDDRPYEEAQYRRLADLVTVLVNTYPGLSLERIVTHCDIAPHRKTDPGPFFRRDFMRHACYAETP